MFFECTAAIYCYSVRWTVMPRGAMSASPAGQSLTAALQGAASDRPDFGSMTVRALRELCETYGMQRRKKVGAKRKERSKDELVEALEASQANKGVQPLTADPASGSAQAYQQMDLADSASGKSQAYEEMSAQDLRELAKRNPDFPKTKMVGNKYVHTKKRASGSLEGI